MTLTEERPGATIAARRAMIDSQLRVSGVNDARVIAAMAAGGDCRARSLLGKRHLLILPP
jgi:hypothetical protein